MTSNEAANDLSCGLAIGFIPTLASLPSTENFPCANTEKLPVLSHLPNITGHSFVSLNLLTHSHRI